jgi:5-formyltetrahydrofolate cyclo-ligase
MEAKEIFSLRDLRPGNMNLTEPGEHCPVCPPDDIALVIVPCLSCDLSGNRLGYGGGYYDRYLKRFSKWEDRPAVQCVVLCRERMISQNLPKDPWDVQMEYYATEAGLFAALPAGL